MKKRKFSFSTFFLTAVLMVGLGIMLYPTVSDWWNSHTQSRAVASYDKVVAELDDGKAEELLAEAHD